MSFSYGVSGFRIVGDLHHMKRKMYQASYKSILQHHATPSVTRLVGQGIVIKQNNDTKYIGKLRHSYIKSKEKQHFN